MKKILITGSTGLVGSEAVKLFTEKGWEVTGIDNNMRRAFFDTESKTPQISLDIRNEGAINELFRKHNFDAVIHAAAQPSHDYSKDHPMLDFYVNVVGTLNLLEATRRHCPHAVFVFVSTDKIYGEGMTRELEEQDTRYHSDSPFDETTLTKPMWSPFGAGKLAADAYVQEYGHQYGMKTACFRPGCITGKNHQGAEMHGFLAYLVKCIKTGKPYKIFGFKGKQVRDQIHAHDLVNAFYHFIENPKVAAVYNIGGGPDRSVSVLEAIGLIGVELGYKLGDKIDYSFHEARKGDRQWDVHDVSKFRKDYPDWDYEYSLSDITKDVCSTK